LPHTWVIKVELKVQAEAALLPCGPFAPVRRMERYWPAAIGFYPAAKNAAAGKDDGMWPIKVDDGHLQVLFEWCSFNPEPVHDAETILSSAAFQR
jgi:hypothetical protein